MLGDPTVTRVWIAVGVTAMRSVFPALAAKVQTALEENPLGSDVFIPGTPRRSCKDHLGNR